MHMAIQPSLGVRGGICPDITGITLRQVPREEIGLLLDATDDKQRFTKVSLRLSLRMAQWYKHLARIALLAVHVIRDDGIAPTKAAFVTKTLKEALGLCGVAYAGAPCLPPTIDQSDQHKHLTSTA